MALTLSTNLSNALLGAAHRVAWGQLLCTTLGNTITLSCKRDSTASAADPYSTGTEFLNIGITAPFTYDSDTGDVTVGKLFGTNARAAADLSTGKSVFRIISGSNYFQGTIGLPGSGADLIFTVSPTLLTGFSLTSLVIKAPLALPINGDGVALGGKATDITFQNTSASTITNQVATFGQVFKKGALPANNTSLSLVADSTLPTQIDIKSVYNDGSIKHAILSTVVPTLAASASKTYDLIRNPATGTASPTVPADFSGLTSVVTIVNAGVTYTSTLSALLNGSYATWLIGDVASEWIGVAPLVDSSSNAHPGLTVRFNVRAYKGTGRARVDVIVENTKATIGSSTPLDHYVYDISVSVAGSTVFSKSTVPHLPNTRFRKTFWYGGAAPTLHIRHNIPYLIATKAVPNYDPTLINATLTSLESSYLNTSQTTRNLFQNGVALPYMPTTGGRPDIGILPGWDAMLVLGMNPAMREVCFVQTDLMGAWSTHFRDPATDQPVSAIDSPNFVVPRTRKFNITAISGANPAVITTSVAHGYVPGMLVYIQDTVQTADNNPGVGVGLNYSERVVGAVTSTTFELVGVNTTGKTYSSAGTVTVSNANAHDTSHVPSVGFLSYMLSGDHYHMEEMAFYTSASSGGQLVHGRQLRAQAWTLRDQGQANFIMPDSYRLKGHFGQLLSLNVADYNSKYISNAQANKLGVIVGGSAWSDPDSSGYVTRTWQDDFFTQSIGRLLELGFKDFAPLFAFKAKYVVSRITYCRMLACPYSMKVRSDNSSDNNVFQTIEQAYAATYPVDYPSAGNNILAQVFDSAAMAAQAKPLNDGADLVANSMLGNAGNPLGYVANMQPALAYAVTHNASGASAAWTRYDGRVLKQSDFGAYPEFAIVPRSQ